jgi:SAM-dependent methyltransferase
VRSIPRFVPQENYAANFGFQWNHFRRTQLDSYTGTQISRERFLKQTAWQAGSLEGREVLDVGCGSGRFAEIALALGAHVIAVDFSSAVEACYENFRDNPGLDVIQADVYQLPLRRGSFDLVYCFGVLQHTPDPARALLALPEQLKEGGQLAVDVYSRHWKSYLHPKYLLRPVSTRIPNALLFRMVERTAPALLSVSRAVGRIPALGKYLRRMVPVANYEGVYPLSEQHLAEFAVLDTFDWLSPVHDKPQSPEVMRTWLEQAGLEEVEVLKVFHLVGRGRKPVASSSQMPSRATQAAGV